jgi:outer membrane protein OmpA-like peptidoglycan-associated protein/tetratricopeptide (TPR) repeat protein
MPSLFFGQERPLSTKNKKAIEHYHNAQRYYDSRLNDNAIAELHAALKEDTSFVEAHGLLAYLYQDIGKMEDGIKEIKKLLNINPHFSNTMYFTVAEMEINIGNYPDALKDLETYQQHPVSDPDIQFGATIGIADCKFAIEALKHPVPFNPKNMGININSENSEYFPAVTADGETFLFTRDIPDNTSIYGHQEDFFVSYKINGEWTKAVNVGPPLNTSGNEGAPTLSADGHLLIFTGCDRDGGYGSCDLYYSYKVGKNWTAGRNLGAPVNTRNWETQPSLASDGRTLYFIRGTETRQGLKDQDIYMTVLSDSGYWSNPEKLSDTINTPGQEESVFIADDNQTLYFSSDGHPGMGGLDIFMSRRLPNGRWGIPKNLGYPINTSKDESSIVVDPNGHVAYFSSDREGGYGGRDFYSFELYDSAQPKPITYVKGKVYDSKTTQPLVAQFNLIDLKTGKVMVQSSSAHGDGTFLVCLPLNKDYALNVSRKGYLFYSENFSLTDANASSTKPYMLDIPLQPIDTGATIVLKNIFFETDMYKLKHESEIELNKLVNFLDANPTVKIQVSGHTDNTGTIPHNNELSKNRAKSVYDYLVSHTISADRLSYKGYGQSRPIADNSTEAGKAKNRRTEMKIVAK